MQSRFWLCRLFSRFCLYSNFSLFFQSLREGIKFFWRLKRWMYDKKKKKKYGRLLSNIHIWNFLFYFSKKTDFSFVYFFVCKKLSVFDTWFHSNFFLNFFSFISRRHFQLFCYANRETEKIRTCKKLNKNLGIYTLQVFVLFLLIPTDTQTTMGVETKKKVFSSSFSSLAPHYWSAVKRTFSTFSSVSCYARL